ncbi:radical SAM protein [Halobacteriovorax vibrionivorans]|uniref:Radical SAM protein n=1 Tax=Halobacteriovorax vibrionivorans TaxID=2152716 RepID=A0ABY0IJS4_9BACT|nr:MULTISPECIES: radical SAM protein [Halobacteriovorax]RZF22815.1 radical SAM protein [Halobacteriovorax vibrionivorans]TGD47392.1 radical SAM protein [Halobacteriovorax sp. Y22]
MQYENQKILEIGQGSPLNINWEMVSHCQYDCSYCYYRPFTSDTNYSTLSKIILKKLKNIEEDFIINLIGGEPTLHPDFTQVIDELISIENLKEIRIVTNFIKPESFWNKIQRSSKIKITASYHPEYKNKDFIKKSEILSDQFNIDIAFLFTNKIEEFIKYKEVFEDAYQLAKQKKLTLNCVRLHKEEYNNTTYEEYDPEIEDFIKESEHKVSSLDNKETTLIKTSDIQKNIAKSHFLANGYNKLKGWKCDIKAFIIHYDAQVSYACKNTKKHILTCDFKTEGIVCPFNLCECDDYWSFKKVAP